MLKLEVGKIYSFADLETEFGTDRSFSFQRNGTVTAFIVNGEMNPSFLNKAPEHGKILVAKGPMRQSIAKKLNSFNPYPTFVKLESNKWIYAGKYKYHDYLTDDETKKNCSKNAKIVLNEIEGVIFLNRVAEKQAVVKKRKAA